MAMEKSKDGVPNEDDEESVAHFKGRVENFIKSHNRMKTIMEKMGDILVRLHNTLYCMIMHVTGINSVTYMLSSDRFCFNFSGSNIL